jgi:serine phosphatase RsbU (regulator of sigma subunit)
MLAQVDSDRRFDRADLALVEDLGRRAALAIDNARLFADRSRVARTLQQSLLPHALPDIPGVEVGAAYRPAGGGSDVGGDFYDVFEIAGGSWVCVMGDVCGKGADAAALTGLVRYTVRATAMRERDPATVLTLLNEAVLRQTSDYRFATVLCGRLDADAGAVRFTLACGGHPLPLLVPAEGRARAVGTPGSLIGALPEIVVRDEVVRLEPGDTVVLFTDGVTEERRVSGEAFGEDGLLRVLDATRGRPAAEIAASVERAVLEFSAEEPRDDIAVLVLRVTPPGPAPASRPLP